jgi:hypothetical protein
MLSLLYPGHAREPRAIEKIQTQEKRIPTEKELDVANELEITNCEEKSAYISNSATIATEMDFLARIYPGKRMYSKKDDMILWEIGGFSFRRVGQTKIPNLYRWIIDSGIFDRLEVEKVARKNRGRKPLVKIKKERLEGVCSLEGGLITLFMLCGGLISLAAVSFIFLECRAIIWRLLVQCYVTSSVAFRKCWSKVEKCRKFFKTRKRKSLNNRITIKFK